VRAYKIFSDGRRQIGAFYLAGDVFGLEMGVAHTFSAEAINGARVVVIKLSAVIELAEQEHDVARRLWALTARELLRVQDHSLLLMKTAQERVASFLIEMVARLPAGSTVELPMSRRDIADYLGLTVETVCRALTQLENTAAIAQPSSRRIVLRNRAALQRLNG
jgi:CRP/FNR family nitrogen fixation transcriptional regulator